MLFISASTNIGNMPKKFGIVIVMFQEFKMNCWICGNNANTGEHKTKASDLRALYSAVSQQKPLSLHPDQRRNQKVGSIKSSKFKFDSLICSYCNNARTARNDRAWEQLSKFLREKNPAFKEGDVISLQQVFPGAISESMLDVHLFFVKLFGCAIMEYRVPVDIRPFSEAILQQIPHPKVFMGFGSSLNMGTGMTNIETADLNGLIVYATWFYVVEPIAVNVIYSDPSEKREGLVHAWHPSTNTQCIYARF